MKKIALFFLLLAFCSYTFAQQWIGNTDASNMVMLENSEFAIAPKHIQADAAGVISKVKFFRTTYSTYTCDTYTLRIYENPNLQLVNEQKGYYDIQSCGTEVYSQDFTVTDEGWVEVELTTPYTIGEADFWISIQMHGEGMLVIGGQTAAVEDDYFYTCEDNYTWYWSYTYFFDSEYNYLLYSCALAVLNGESTEIADAQPAVCSVFPNPTQDVVKVIAENTIQTVTVFDVFGKQVRAFDVDAAHATLPLADLPAGTYIFKMQTADDIFTRKIVKQ